MPACVTMPSSSIPRSPDSLRVFMSSSSTALKGCLSFHSGCKGAIAFTRSSIKASWTYIGCSHHSVPSLSKVAMRSAGGTKSGEPCLVTRSTKVTIAFLGAVSFHDGNGSWAKPGAVDDIAIDVIAAMRTQFRQTVFMGETSMGQSADDGCLPPPPAPFRNFEAPSRCSRSPRPGVQLRLYVAYLAIAFLAAAIFSFTASRLKLAPFCIGGNSIAVIASFSTTSWTSTKRQNSYLYHSQYCSEPFLVRFSGKPVRSNGSRRRLMIAGTSGLILSPSQPPGWSIKRYL